MMPITERVDANTTTLTLSRRFDFHARKPFQEAVCKGQAEVGGALILLLEQVPFVDGAALGLLILPHKKLKLSHRQLLLDAPQTFVREICELADFFQLMPIYASTHEIILNQFTE